MISFTGSTRAGKAISGAAAQTLKRVTLELGGKGANIIFADADQRAVVRGVRDCFLWAHITQQNPKPAMNNNVSQQLWPKL
jgi:acyl-CoA reductase-like NAD-dependent aldehyde dehydrogenase